MYIVYKHSAPYMYDVNTQNRSILIYSKLMLFLKNNEYNLPLFGLNLIYKFLNLYTLSLIFFLFFYCMYKAEPMEEINEAAPMEGMTGDATMEEVNGAAAMNVVNGAGVNGKFSHAYLPELSFIYVCLVIYLSA